MNHPDGKCYEHSTFVSNVIQTRLLLTKIDELMVRMNVILGGVAVACLLLAINLVFKI